MIGISRYTWLLGWAIKDMFLHIDRSGFLLILAIYVIDMSFLQSVVGNGYGLLHWNHAASTCDASSRRNSSCVAWLHIWVVPAGSHSFCYYVMLGTLTIIHALSCVEPDGERKSPASRWWFYLPPLWLSVVTKLTPNAIAWLTSSVSLTHFTSRFVCDRLPPLAKVAPWPLWMPSRSIQGTMLVGTWRSSEETSVDR